MRKSRLTILAVAVTAVFAVSAAPASAQTPTPPCNPVTLLPVVPDVANCVFDIAQWANATVQPANLIELVRGEANLIFDSGPGYANILLDRVDEAQKKAVAELCIILARPPEQCPQL